MIVTGDENMFDGIKVDEPYEMPLRDWMTDVDPVGILEGRGALREYMQDGMVRYTPPSQAYELLIDGRVIGRITVESTELTFERV